MSSGQTVFLIDDDMSARNGLARLMRTAGYQVQISESAISFLGDLDSQAAGCIVLDARMPKMTGQELQRELKDRDVCLPIIFVTADDDPELRRKAQKMKAAGFFRKPVDGTALLDAIDWALRSREV